MYPPLIKNGIKMLVKTNKARKREIACGCELDEKKKGIQQIHNCICTKLEIKIVAKNFTINI